MLVEFYLREMAKAKKNVEDQILQGHLSHEEYRRLTGVLYGFVNALEILEQCVIKLKEQGFADDEIG